MFYKIRDRINRLRFAVRCKAILRSAPIALAPSSDLALLTQLQHKDVLLFLLAAKSFAKQVPPGAIFVLNDGSLRRDDVALLEDHMPGVALLDLAEFRSAHCPTGGTWERLLAIAHLIDQRYVVQLDSDTLTVDGLDEVRDCVRQKRPFVLGTWDRQEIETMPERWQTANVQRPGRRSHVQLFAEANFDKLRDFRTLRYVRGCSGFTGFPRRSFSRSFVEAISGEMKAALGDKWNEWGSEQVMSNIVLANIAQCLVLPHPRYADCSKMKSGQTAFIHFIGSCRFKHGTYARLGASVAGTL